MLPIEHYIKIWYNEKNEFMENIADKMDKSKICDKMRELQEKIDYQFNDEELLALAMNSVKISCKEGGKNHKEYANEGLATVGDAVLKVVIADHLYEQGVKTKGAITIKKSELENNETFYNITKEEGLMGYAYNEAYFQSDNPPQHKQVVHKAHDPYIEAIVGAIFKDCGFNGVKKWILTWLLPRLEKYKK